MKNYKQKFLVAVLTVMTMVGVADASIAKNPAYAQSVDTKALAMVFMALSPLLSVRLLFLSVALPRSSAHAPSCTFAPKVA